MKNLLNEMTTLKQNTQLNNLRLETVKDKVQAMNTLLNKITIVKETAVKNQSESKEEEHDSCDLVLEIIQHHVKQSNQDFEIQKIGENKYKIGAKVFNVRVKGDGGQEIQHLKHHDVTTKEI